MSDFPQSAIAEIYEAAASGRFLELLPDLVAGMAGARSCVIQKTDERLNPISITQCWFTAEMSEAYVAEQIFLDDVWANCAMENGIFDRTVDLGEVTGRDRYARSRFYQDFIRKFGDDTGHCMGSLLRRPSGGFLTFGIHRAERAETFADEDVRLLNLLNPHFLRAAAIDEKLGESRQETNQMRAALDRLERPLVILGPLRQITLINPAAEAIAARHDGLTLTSAQLNASDPSSQRRLTQAIGTALTHGGSQGGDVLVERRDGRPAYRLTVAPIAVQGITHAMVLIDDPDSEPFDAARRLSELYGFTRAEAEVAMLVAQGHSAEEIAAARDVGAATIKTLLQRCFRKSDTNRATQLARMVNRLPR